MSPGSTISPWSARARRDLSELTDEDLLNIIGSVGAELRAEPATILVEDAPRR
jgi:hypothetical protein